MKIIINLLFIFVAMNSAAQDRYLTLEQLIPGGTEYSDFVPKTGKNYRWERDKLITYNKEEKAPEIHPIKSELEWKNTSYCKENKHLAFTIDHNLYIAAEDGKPVAITTEGNPGIVYGQSVHRNEFGIKNGIFWSPKGNFLAFYRMDETMVTDYPLVDISTRIAELKDIKYPMAGMTSHEVTLGVYNMQSGTTVYLNTGEPKDHYLTNISWDPSEDYIYIAELNRDQNHMQLNCYDIRTGECVKTLFEERSDKYVEPENPLLFLTTKPNQFIWQSKRDGYKHLYLYDTNGKLLKQITSGDFDVSQVIGMDKEEKNLFYISNEESPIDYHIYKVELRNNKKTRLTEAPGVHSAMLNESGTQIIDRYSNQTTPLAVDLIDVKKKKITSLEIAEDPYRTYTLPEISLGSIKAADGESDLFYRLIKPTGFDPTQEYPVIMYVYGGPHSQMVKNNWMGSVRGWEIYMAQKGYVVFCMDNRGTTNRGQAFEQVTFRQLGIEETADQVEAARFLQSLPYVDRNRIGVHGWSYGGFMTMNLLLRHPELFKVGVAGGPVVDWKYYEVMYGERYMDAPQDNPEGYEKTNLNNLAGNLEGRLLLIHGDEDPVVVWQHSLSFLKACITARTYPDYFVYPGHGHNMMGRDRVHLHEKITRYFDDYLK